MIDKKSVFEGQEIKTKYGWGCVKEIRSDGIICIALEDFEGFLGKTGPILFTNLDQKDDIISIAVCPIGSAVITKYGSGVLINFVRDREIYVVRLWSSGGSLGTGIGYMSREDIIEHFSSNESLTNALTRTTNPFNMSSCINSLPVNIEEAVALPTIELILSAIPTNASMQQSALQLITKVMVSLEGVQTSAAGEGISIIFGDNEEVFDSAQFIPASKVKSFITDVRVLLEEGENRIIEHVTEKKMAQEQIDALYSHWQKVSTVIQEIVLDLKGGLFNISSDGEERLEGAEIESTGLDAGKMYEFIKKLRTHVVTIRKLFDVTEDYVSGLDVIASIISEFRQKAFAPFETLPGLISEKLGSILPESDFLNSKLDAIIAKDKRKLGKRVGMIVSKLLPAASIFDSTPSLASFREIEDLLDATIEFFEKSNLPQLALSHVSSRVSSPMLLELGTSTGLNLSNPDELTNMARNLHNMADDATKDISLESVKSGISSGVQTMRSKVDILDLSEFKLMIHMLIISIVHANEGLDSYTLRKLLVDSPHVGLVLLICHLYQAKDLSKIPLVSMLKESIPLSIQLFIKNYVLNGEDDVESSSDSNLLTLHDLMIGLDSFDKVTNNFVANADGIVSNIEVAQSSDTYQLALAHLSTLDIGQNLMQNTQELLLASNLGSPNSPGGMDMFGAAEAALTDEAVRSRLIENVKVKVLDFLVSYIPTINITSLDGKYENVEYSVSGLDLSGFRFDKDSISLNMDEDLSSGREVLTFEAKGITAVFNGVKWKYQQMSFPHLSGAGAANANVEDASIQLGFKIVRVPKGVIETIEGDLGCFNEAGMHILPKYAALKKQIKLLCTCDDDIRQDSTKSYATLQQEGCTWEECENPWVGTKQVDADAEINTDSWEPVLLISSKTIKMEKLSLTIQNDGYAWIYNMLASIFTNVLKSSICNALTDLIGSSSSILLLTVNSVFSSKWDMVQRIMPFDIARLPICSTREFLTLIGTEAEDEEEKAKAASASLLPAREYTLKFKEEGPLGMKLDLVRDDAQVDMVSRTVVRDVFFNSQASRVCDDLGWPKNFLLESTVLTVNGARLYNAPKEKIYSLLSGRRPLFLHCRLTDEAYNYLRQHSEIMAKAAAEEASKYILVTFKEGPMGMVLSEVATDRVVVVKSLARGPKDVLLQAEASRKIKPGFVVLGINGKVLKGKRIKEVQDIFKRTSRPVTLLFAKDTACAHDASPIRIKELYM
jgi:hypothetical protein